MSCIIYNFQSYVATVKWRKYFVLISDTVASDKFAQRIYGGKIYDHFQKDRSIYDQVLLDSKNV